MKIQFLNAVMESMNVTTTKQEYCMDVPSTSTPYVVILQERNGTWECSCFFIHVEGNYQLSNCYLSCKQVDGIVITIKANRSSNAKFSLCFNNINITSENENTLIHVFESIRTCNTASGGVCIKPHRRYIKIIKLISDSFYDNDTPNNNDNNSIIIIVVIVIVIVIILLIGILGTVMGCLVKKYKRKTN